MITSRIIKIVNPDLVKQAGETKRWHTRFTHRPETVLEHGAAVALLALWLSEGLLSEGDLGDLLLLSLIHDLHETKFGDVPYPAKALLRAMDIDIDGICSKEFWGGYPSHFMTDRVRNLVDVADVLAAALFAQSNAPAIADLVAEQAARAARELLGSDRKVLDALGVIG